ncbi:NUDIX domain-containing protein [Aggregatimonas sangjinii]|uniref:NUDIX domain-containing protein n=1 Tax=Aggregatimonas sangjinii TaxID=2583587 RepID=A0A5B7STS2_9FLAO|nr:NUDIX domain-containing protein [Aggregatimonas sangjinii]QCX00301.1 NUDIX domain-containing protein [Aggregatimonas sangjinii]
MDELLDILDANGNFTGSTAIKSLAHRDGLFHATVHIWFYTADGQVLLQQRGKDKNTHPLLWDVSVAGHVSAGEQIETAALREIEEEIGLSVGLHDLQKTGVFKSIQKHDNGSIDCEFHHTFLCELFAPFKKLRPQASEVEELALISLDDFSTDVLDGQIPERYVPHASDYYRAVLSKIRECLT